jgi:hypothetical protein
MSGFSRNPKQMTFREVFSEFGKGTLSSSSPASRRGSFMAFSPHHRRSVSREDANRPSVSARVSSRPPQRYSSAAFERLNSLLLRSHFTSIFSAMHEEGLIDSELKHELLESLNHPNWIRESITNWIRFYAIFIEDRDLTRFINNLLP